MTAATVRIVGHHLPGLICGKHRNVYLGLQRKKGTPEYVPGDAAEAVFEVPLDYLAQPDGSPDYRGNSVHGTPGQRFIYLVWGDLDQDGEFAMFSRAKLQLSKMPTELTGVLAEGGTVEAELELTAGKGGPLCASIAPELISWSAST